MTRTQLEKIIREELETTLDESNIFDNIRKKKAYCKKNPSAKKCQREDRPSEKNWKKATQNEDLDEAETKPCKPLMANVVRLVKQDKQKAAGIALDPVLRKVMLIVRALPRSKSVKILLAQMLFRERNGNVAGVNQ